MYPVTLVKEVYKVIEKLRVERGEYKLAMLYNSDLEMSTSWNLIISSSWTDQLEKYEATRVIVDALQQNLGAEYIPAIARITVLKTNDPFVEDMTYLYPVLTKQGGVPVGRVTAGDVTDGVAHVFYSQPQVAA